MSLVALQPPLIFETFSPWVYDLLDRVGKPVLQVNASGWLPVYEIDEQAMLVGEVSGLEEGPARAQMLVVFRNSIASVTLETQRIPVILAWHYQTLARLRHETPKLDKHYPWLKEYPEAMLLCQLRFELSPTRQTLAETRAP